MAIDRGMRKEEVGEHHGRRAERKIVELRMKTKAALVGRSFCAAGGFQVGWVFSDPVVATAILNGLLHHSHVITIRGDSHLSKEKRRSGLLQKPASPSEKQL
ncbi:ATP-binding protein [Bradyrhizobium barranii subsp. apii]|uniref:ATP-binding protein n=1 Tax=Bradyrhizobium barranii subsp. apii TaxID=2819348 RepID=A0A8T5VHL4_9BRAD|nr:ATP-binding protein [Bradyrhizobium barranii]UPT90408.1 ATP-binding protein [Bradyrhizobium barranii subsp. apii]